MVIHRLWTVFGCFWCFSPLFRWEMHHSRLSTGQKNGALVGNGGWSRLALPMVTRIDVPLRSCSPGPASRGSRSPYIIRKILDPWSVPSSQTIVVAPKSTVFATAWALVQVVKFSKTAAPRAATASPLDRTHSRTCCFSPFRAGRCSCARGLCVVFRACWPCSFSAMCGVCLRASHRFSRGA